jgi:hypothetical protein
MKPVITPSRRKLCGRSAIGSSYLVRFHSCGENTQPRGIFQARARACVPPEHGEKFLEIVIWHRSRHQKPFCSPFCKSMSTGSTIDDVFP